MIDALYISATGLRGQQQQIDVISNNVANMQTPAYKKSRVNFAQIVGGGTAEGGVVDPSAHGGGVRVVSTQSMFGAGEVKMTLNPLDIAIEGNGFVEVEDASGAMLYTRAGQLKLDSEGFLTNAAGMRLSQGIQIPPDAEQLRITPEGEVFARLGGDDEDALLGAIELAQFAAPDALVSRGDNLFAPGDGAGDVSFGRAGEGGLGKIRQGFIEMSNVDLVDEMTTLVLAQRAYQLNARVLQASDQILETINNLRR